MAFSRAQIDQLGYRLRQSETISDADLALLQEFRAEHVPVLAEVQRRIEETLPGVDQTARIKTIQTLHDKLRRETTRLSQLQDIAGVRIVEDMGLADQDRMVRALLRAFPDARVVDRRAQPTHGYRAVHLVASVDRRLCEIQVRTAQQHTWAEVVERLADRWGRQIRYGGEPSDPDAPAGNTTRREFWGIVVQISDMAHDLEEMVAVSTIALEATDEAMDEGLFRLRDARERMTRLMADLIRRLESGAPL